MSQTSDTPPRLTAIEWCGINAALDEHDELCERLSKAERELNSAKERIEKLKRYCRHPQECFDSDGWRYGKCTCGLSNLLEEIKA